MALGRRRKHSSHQRCAWTASGWTCSFRVAEVMVNGTKVKCRFCDGHQCKKNDGGMPCGVATGAGYRFCMNRGFFPFPFSSFPFLPLGESWRSWEGLRDRVM